MKSDSFFRKGMPRFQPAQFTMMSGFPSASATSRCSEWMLSSAVTSTAKASARPASSAICSAARLPASIFTSAMATAAPRDASSPAIARPIPEAPPVMTATRFSNRSDIRFLPFAHKGTDSAQCLWGLVQLTLVEGLGYVALTGPGQRYAPLDRGVSRPRRRHKVRNQTLHVPVQVSIWKRPLDDAQALGFPPGDELSGEHEAQCQIGRASCRERVEIS